MEKVTLRHIYIEIGRMCNLNCAHCCKGESEDVEMSDEVMDALLDNVYFIDEISVSGGEPMLYIERIKTLLDKCKSKKIRVNYFNIITNCTMKSEAFVEIFNEWIDYCVFGNKCSILISNDSFHIEQREKYGMAKVDEVASWYSEKLKDCVFGYSDNGATMLTDREHIVLEGRAKNIDERLLNKYCKTSKIVYEPTYDGICQINKKCVGAENLCNYGEVNNCVRKSIYLNVYGELYRSTFPSFESQRKHKEICIGNIINESIYECISKWNEKCENAQLINGLKINYDNSFNILYNVITKADYLIVKANIHCIRGDYNQAEECIDTIEKIIWAPIKTIYEMEVPINRIIEYIEEAGTEEERQNRILEFDEDGQLTDVCRRVTELNDRIDLFMRNITTYRKNIRTRRAWDMPGCINIYPSLSAYKAKTNLI